MAKIDLTIQEKILAINDIFKDDSIYPRENIDEKLALARKIKQMDLEQPNILPG